MKKAKILSGVLLLCFSSPLISQAATLDVRGGGDAANLLI